MLFLASDLNAPKQGRQAVLGTQLPRAPLIQVHLSSAGEGLGFAFLVSAQAGIPGPGTTD